MTAASEDKCLEENIRDAATLSRALWVLMAGIVENAYPHVVDNDGLLAIYQLATEVRDRTDAANRQYEAEAHS